MVATQVCTTGRLLVSVGSTHFDNRSFRLDDEATLNIIDATFAKEQTAIFEADPGRSRRIGFAERAALARRARRAAGRADRLAAVILGGRGKMRP